MAKSLNAEFKTRDSANRHKYQGFTERLSQVKVDVSHRLVRAEFADSEPIENSYFLEAFQRCTQGDFTQQFANFSRDVRQHVQSLPLIIFHRRSIVDALLRHLRVPGSPARKSLLDLLSVLARDIRQEFYPFFNDAALTLLEIIDPQNPELLEQIFTCLAFLFKFLVKYLLVDLERVFDSLYANLLAHRKPHIRRFAAESFGYLLRKLRVASVASGSAVAAGAKAIGKAKAAGAGKEEKKRQATAGAAADANASDDVEMRDAGTGAQQSSSSASSSSAVPSLRGRAVDLASMLETVLALPAGRESTEEYRDGLGLLLFEMVKGLQFGFHSNAPQALPILLRVLDHNSRADVPDPVLELDHRFDVLHRALRRMTNHTRAEKASVLWSPLFERSKLLLDKYASELKQPSAAFESRTVELARVASLLTVVVRHRQGTRIVDKLQVLSYIERFLAGDLLLHPKQSQVYLSSALNLLSSFWKLELEGTQSRLSDLLSTVFELQQHPLLILPLIAELRSLSDFHRIVTRHVVRFAESLIATQPHAALSLLLECCSNSSDSSSVDPEGLPTEPIADTDPDSLNPNLNTPLLRFAPNSQISAHLLATIRDAVSGDSSLDEHVLAHLWSCLHLLPLAGFKANHAVQKTQSAAAASQRKKGGSQQATSGSVPLTELLDTLSAKLTEQSRAASASQRELLLHVRARCDVSRLILTAAEPSFASEAPKLWPRIVEMLKADPGQVAVLRTAATFIDTVARLGKPAEPTETPAADAKDGKEAKRKAKPAKQARSFADAILNHTELAALLPVLAPNFALACSSVRVLTGRSLARFPPLLYEESATSTKTDLIGPCPMLAWFHELSALLPLLSSEREFTRRLRDLETTIQLRRLPELYLQAVPHFLIGMFRVKLSPVWTIAQAVLATLASLHPNLLWPIFAKNLEWSNKQTLAVVPKGEASPMDAVLAPSAQRSSSSSEKSPVGDSAAMEADDEDEDVHMETEDTAEHEAEKDAEDDEEAAQKPRTKPRKASKKDKNRRRTVKLSSLVSSAPAYEPDLAPHLSLEAAGAPLDSTSNSVHSDELARRFRAWTAATMRASDPLSFHKSLWQAMTQGGFVQLADRKTKELVEAFLEFLKTEHDIVFPPQDDVEAEQTPNHRLVHGARYLVKTKLALILKVFSLSLNNPGPLQQSQLLHDTFFRFLTKSDANLQELALLCLVKWNQPYLKPYKDRLLRLIGETTFREEMALFHLDPQAGVVTHDHRAQLAPVLIRVLYPKLVQRRTTKKKTTLQSRRAAILAFLGGLTARELSHLFVIMLQPFRACLERACPPAAAAAAAPIECKGNSTAKGQQLRPAFDDVRQWDGRSSWHLRDAVLGDDAREVATQKQHGLLKVIEFLLAQVRSLTAAYLPHLATIVLHILHRANQRLNPASSASAADDGKSESAYVLSELREIRQLCYARLATILDLYPQFFAESVGPASSSASSERKDDGDDAPSLIAQHLVDMRPWLDLFLELTQPALKQLAAEATQHRSGLLECMVVLSKHRELLHVFAPPLLPAPSKSAKKSSKSQLKQSSALQLLPPLFSLLSAKHVSRVVANAVIEIVENLLAAERNAVTEIEQRAKDRHQSAIESQRVEKHKQLQAGLKAIGGLDNEDMEDEGTEVRKGVRVAVTESLPQSALDESALADDEADRAARDLIARLQATWRQQVPGLLEHMHVLLTALASSHADAFGNSGKREEQAAAVVSGGRRTKKPATPRIVFPKRELAVVAQLSSYATDPSTARKLVDLLLPFLKVAGAATGASVAKAGEGRLSKDQQDAGGRIASFGLSSKEQAKLSIMTIIRDMVPLLADAESLVSFLSRQFYLLRTGASRSMLAEVFQALARKVDALQPVVSLLSDLNAMQAQRLDEADFTRRLAAYSTITDAFADPANKSASAAAEAADGKQAGSEDGDVDMQAADDEQKQQKSSPPPAMREWSALQLTPVVYNMLHDLHQDEFGLRTAAAHALNIFIKFLADQAAAEATTAEVKSKAKKQQQQQSAEDTVIRPPSLITLIVYPTLKKNLSLPKESVRRESLLLLSQLVRLFPKFYASLLPLTHENADFDFFACCAHIQLHRRRKALAQLQTQCAEGQISPTVAAQILMPLLSHFVYETGTTRKALAAQGAEHGLVEETVRAFASVSLLLPWSQWFAALSSYLKQIPRKPELEKLLLRVVCAMIDSFHFPIAAEPSQAELADAERDKKAREARAKRAEAEQEQEQQPSAAAAADVEMRPAEAPADGLGLGGTAADKPAPAEGEEEIKGDEKSEAERKEADEAEANEGDEPEPDENAEAEGDSELAVEQKTSAQSAEDAAEKERLLAIKVRDTLARRLIPQLHYYLMVGAKSEVTMDETDLRKPGKDAGLKRGKAKQPKVQDTIRAPVAMALVRLLKKLPQNIFEREFPKLVAVLCTQLQRREQSARDGTRKTLVSVLEVVGPHYLYFIVTELIRSLKRGYQLHVLGVVVFLLLQSLVDSKAPVGCIDHCLETLTPVLMSELVGEVAAQKDVEAIRNSCREAKARRAPDCFQLLARLVRFEPNINLLVGPLRDALLQAQSTQHVAVLADALKRVVDGLFANSSVETPALLRFIHATVKDSSGTKPAASSSANGDHAPMDTAEDGDEKGADEQKLSKKELAMRRRVTKEQTFAVQQAPSKQSKLASSHNSNTLMAFGLQLLLAAFSKGRLNTNDAQVLAMLDPYVALLRDCCLAIGASAVRGGSKKKKRGSQASVSLQVISLALRCSAFLIRAELPSRQEYVPSLADFVFSLLHGGVGGGATSAELTQPCFRALGVIIRHCEFYSLTEAQLQLLVSFVAHDLNALAPSKQHVAFFLLRAIMSRRFTCPELYDLVKRVAELMVQSTEAAVQEQCSAVFLQFLLEYKMKEKRLEQHFSFVLNNLSYPLASGRMAVANLLDSLIFNMPAKALELRAELFFLPLVQALHNDEDAAVRQRVATVLRHLLQKIPASKQDAAAAFALKWLAAKSNPLLQQAAAQVLGILVETVGAAFEKHLQPFITQLKGILQLAVASAGQEPQDATADASVVASLSLETDGKQSSRPAQQSSELDELRGMEEEEQKEQQQETAAADAEADGERKEAKRSTADLNEDEEMDSDAEGSAAAKSGKPNGIHTETKSSDSSINSSAAPARSTAWKLPYLSLIALEKAAKVLPKQTQNQLRAAQIWPMLVELSLHPHAWIRHATARVIGVYFVSLDPAACADAKYVRGTLMESEPALMKLAAVFCEQLASEQLSSALGEQVVKNLVFAMRALHASPVFLDEKAFATAMNLERDEPEAEAAAAGAGSGAEDEDGEAEEPSPDAGDSKEGKGSAETLATGSNRKRKRQSKAAPPPFVDVSAPVNYAMKWIFSRLSYTARSENRTIVESIFTLFAAMATSLKPDELRPFLVAMLNPLFRVVQTGASEEQHADEATVSLRSFAQQVLDLLQERLGAALFVQAYNFVRESVMRVRQIRKKKRAQLAVTAPDKFAKRKIERGIVKRHKKKEKLAANKLRGKDDSKKGKGKGTKRSADADAGGFDRDTSSEFIKMKRMRL